MSNPSETAVKTLFAHSRNQCFFTGCENELTKAGWKQVAGEIAHIRGEQPGSARYEADQPDSERQGFDNLMLLCPGDHKLIDRLEPDNYPVERLVEMKEKHLEHASERDWCTDDEALRFAVMAIHFWQSQTMPRLRIGSARYGADETFEDVTDIVARNVVGDRLRMEVTNETMGGDPLRDVIKELRIQYQYDGVLNSSTTTEGESVSIP